MTDKTTVTQEPDMSWFDIAVTRKKEVVITDHSAGWADFDIEHWWEDTFAADVPTHLAPGMYRWQNFNIGWWDEDDAINVTGGDFIPHRLAHQPAPDAVPVINALRQCFDEDALADRTEARARWIEEATELFQAAGGTIDELTWTGAQVFAKPVDPVALEVGQVVTALHRIAYAFGINVQAEAEKDRLHISQNAAAIRDRHAVKERYAHPPAGSADVLTMLVDIFQKIDGGRDAPKHHHTIPGIWDADNPPDIAGKPCEWCAQWSRARAAIAALTPPAEDASHD